MCQPFTYVRWAPASKAGFKVSRVPMIDNGDLMAFEIPDDLAEKVALVRAYVGRLDAWLDAGLFWHQSNRSSGNSRGRINSRTVNAVRHFRLCCRAA